ncbi:MAG: thioredoxin family protein [Ignavibacteriae bacterium]|nr:thioredoxin family protein [Ignavibacteriota bacterium]
MKRFILITSIILVFVSSFHMGTLAQSQKPKVTFIELGSVSCIPCKKMQPIMESLEKKYGEQLKIIFYDVWKSEHKDKAKKYGIRLIPTQVFLDENGKEIHRHEGYYPEEKIEEFLQSKGLMPIKKKVSK